MLRTRLDEPRWLVVSAKRLTVDEAATAVCKAFEVLPVGSEIEIAVEPGLLGNVYVHDRDSLDREFPCCGDPADCQEGNCG